VKFNAGTTESVANVVDNSVHVIAYASNITGVAQRSPTNLDYDL